MVAYQHRCALVSHQNHFGAYPSPLGLTLPAPFIPCLASPSGSQEVQPSLSAVVSLWRSFRFVGDCLSDAL
jgi:hypothetical protein